MLCLSSLIFCPSPVLSAPRSRRSTNSPTIVANGFSEITPGPAGQPEAFQILARGKRQIMWINSDMSISELLLGNGNVERSLAILRESLSIFQRLVETHPDNNDNHEGLSASYAAYGAEYRHRAVQLNSSKSKRLVGN